MTEQDEDSVEEKMVKKKKTKTPKTKKKKNKVKKKVDAEEDKPAPTEPSDDDTFNLNFTVISCRNLLKGDVRSSDPYVSFFLGETRLHKTGHLRKTLNPVFGPGENNVFSAKINYGELKKAGGLIIQVKDWDRIGNNDLIGFSTVEPSQLLEFSRSGKTSSIKLQVPPDRNETSDAGFIDLAIDDPDREKEQAKKPSQTTSSDPPEDPSEVLDADDDPEMNEKLQLNFKVVSCRNLLKGDVSSSDPYVKFLLGKKELHRTKNLLNTLNPVFGPQHRNEFNTEIVFRDLVQANGVTIEVMDWDAVGGHDIIGYVDISPEYLSELTESGKPTSIQLQVPAGRKEKTSGYMILRIQYAEEESDDEW